MADRRQGNAFAKSKTQPNKNTNKRKTMVTNEESEQSMLLREEIERGEHSDTYERHKNKVRKNVLLRFNVQSPALWCVEHRMLRGMWAARDCNVCVCAVLLFFASVHRRSLCCMEKRITMIFHTNKKNFLLPFRVTLFFL